MSGLLDQVFSYHEATKHHLHRYARGPGYLDWATQPDPFRRYGGAPLIPLNHIKPGEEPCYELVFLEGQLPLEPLTRATISQLFYDSLAISAWKQAGDARWALRVNPSSGNLHPTEGYLICGPIDGLTDQPIVGHYAPKEHALERRVTLPMETWKTLTIGLPENVVLVGLTSIHWREAWKYGERAFRYCQHDVGHAIATVTLAAAALGWKATLMDDLSSDALSLLMGVFDPQGVEPEQPECLLAVYPQGKQCDVHTLPAETIESFKTLSWEGKPNQLSQAHAEWSTIDLVNVSTQKPPSSGYESLTSTVSPLKVSTVPISFRKIVHQRRSCLALDGTTGMTKKALYEILRKTMSGPGQFPLNALPWSPKIHFGVFIHRVQDVEPGLYFLVRDSSKLADLKAAMKNEFAWGKPDGCPDELDLYRLLTGNTQDVARQISCHQEIAADGCFSLGMIAEYDAPLKKHGPWFYPRLFWEAGLIGQILYLEAEACDIRSTGIGCFFDDSMHQLLGLSDRQYQDLYHFTVGGPIEDTRLTTLPAYPGINI